MIKNERQYRITNAQAQKFRRALTQLQREIAGRLGLKEQQTQRYEATEYASASLARVSAVIAALNVQVREEVSLPA